MQGPYKLLRPLLLASLVGLLTIDLSAQGEWIPDGAEFDRPRLITTTAEVEALRRNLLSDRAEDQPHFREIYLDLYKSVKNTNLPQQATTASARRGSARYAKNASLLLLVDRDPSDEFDTPLDSLTRASFTDQILLALSQIDPNVESFTSYTEWQWRTKELIDYLAAYDILLGIGWESGEINAARERLHTFAGNLYSEASREIIGLSFFTLIRNNHALMVYGALGSAAIVLNDAGSADPAMQPSNWMNSALWWSDDLLWRADDRLSEPDQVAGYAEGPHYLRYAFLNLLPFYRALGNVLPADSIVAVHNGFTKLIPHPYTDPATHRLAEWITGILTPDGLLPSIEDTFVNEAFPELALLGDERWVRRIRTEETTLSGQLNSTVDFRAAFLATGMEVPVIRLRIPQPDVRSFSAAGNAILQSYRGSGLHLGILAEHGRARVEGGGHNQSDAASFYLNYGAEKLALDPGYLSYARRGEVAKATDHNMILINGEGPAPGAVGSVGGADAWIESAWEVRSGEPDWVHQSNLSYVRVKTAYLGAEITRHFFMMQNVDLSEPIVVIADEVSMDSPSTATWQLHGFRRRESSGEGVLLDTAHNAEWVEGDVSLNCAVATSLPSTSRLDSSRHEIGYNRSELHDVLRVESSEPSTRTLFLAGLQGGEYSGRSFQASRVDDTVPFLQIKGNQSARWVVTGDTMLRSIPGAFTTDARVAGRNSTVWEEYMVMIDGTLISQGPEQIQDTLLWTSVRTTVALQQAANEYYYVYVEDPCLMILDLHFRRYQVRGENAESIGLVPGSGDLMVRVTRPGWFIIAFDSDVDDIKSDPHELDLSAIHRLQSE